ncbi:hypothetical protein F5883DRAFT_589548 [Diaporthe sp. PMI_573]|nr:hypothetical protein F5883DRAFT_591543 [Diaporthaceae sp. PMI_573]KAH8744565.1 hypothetical protein F5883DRAFT_589548 [Diaporthaceae sp. PMI_573]
MQRGAERRRRKRRACIKAIHQSKADTLKGSTAWLLWRAVYVTYGMSLRNRVMVPVCWAISWLFGRDISRF